MLACSQESIQPSLPGTCGCLTTNYLCAAEPLRPLQNKYSHPIRSDGTRATSASCQVTVVVTCSCLRLAPACLAVHRAVPSYANAATPVQSCLSKCVRCLPGHDLSSHQCAQQKVKTRTPRIGADTLQAHPRQLGMLLLLLPAFPITAANVPCAAAHAPQPFETKAVGQSQQVCTHAAQSVVS